MGCSLFMTLYTGNKLHSYEQKELTFDDEMIEQEHKLAEKEVNNYSLTTNQCLSVIQATKY